MKFLRFVIVISVVLVIRAFLKSNYLFYVLSPAEPRSTRELFSTVCTIWNMESSERCASECQGSSDDDSVQVQRTPEKLTSIIHFSEAITTFSEMCIAESPVSRQLESQQAKRPSNSRLNEASKQRTLFPAKPQENILWTDDEIYSLIVFLMLFSNGKTWVARKDKKFWEDAATFIKLHSCTSHCRTGKL